MVTMSTRAFARRNRGPDLASPLTSSRLAVFDLDRTLLPGSSLMVLGRALHRAGLVDGRELAGWVAREAAFARRGEGPSTAQRLLGSLLASVAGREAAPYLTVARNLGDELATAAVPGARWLLDMHLAVGDFCVIVSASPQELVEAAARALGAHRAVGTRTQLAGGCFTGRLEGPFCHGRGKLARLWVELGTADLSQATAYSDSASDLPMLKAAGRPVAVNPDRRLRRAAVAAGWPVVRLA
jgi:HAD superfamily hydrolase (TIGR01490 family)